MPVVHPGYGRVVYMPVVHPRYGRRCICPYYTLLYHPGYTSIPPCTSRLPVIAVPGIPMRSDEALGSGPEIIRDMRRIEPLWIPKV